MHDAVPAKETERVCAQLYPLFVIPWTVAHWAPLSMGFFRKEYWGEWPFPSPGDLPDPGIKPVSPVSSRLQADSLLTEPLEKPSLYMLEAK